MKANTRKYSIDLDSKAKGYAPFTILFFVIMAGAFIFFMKVTGNHVDLFYIYNYWYLLLGVIVFELVMLKVVFPDEKVVITVGAEGDLIFELFIESRIERSEVISEVDYWWNYPSEGNSQYRKSGGSSTFDVPSSGVNGGLGSSGFISGLNLYLLLTTNENEKILLHDVGGNWASIPHWKYKLEGHRDHSTVYRCLKIRKLVHQIDSALDSQKDSDLT